MLVVPAEGENVGIIIYPEPDRAAAMPAARVTLVSRAGESELVESAVLRDSVECDAPLLRILGSPDLAWSAGFAGLGAEPLRADSIARLGEPDSLRLAEELIALAASLPTPDQSRFRDLPFGMLNARTIDAGGRQIITTQLVRRIGQEAQPLEERTFMIVARRGGGGAGRLLYHERAEGTEETVTHFELLAVLRASDNPLLLLSKDSPTQPTYSLLELLPDTLRERWTRQLRCGG
jgi:hypothetical protein